ncbi:MAG: c-type cytochrome [Nitrospirota bacterium]|nr:c-type cytochrome [Nitrospirota bacterium]
MRIHRRLISLLFVVLLSLFFISLTGEEASSEKSGESLFKEHCSSCHPDGGNILNPSKTLHRKDREANNIHTAEDIIKKMRNPGPAPTHPQKWAGMTMFDVSKISNDEALKIADYIIKTFE